MRHQSEILKNHANLLIAERLQLTLPQSHDINTFNHNLAGGGFQQTVEMANQG